MFPVYRFFGKMTEANNPHRRQMKKLRQLTARIVFFILLVAVIYALVQRRLFPAPQPGFPTALSNLPFYAYDSFVRMLAAYVLALAFSLAYGSVAALKRGADKIMLPILDILQSVPVLGFFPAAVFFFIGLFHGRLGVELASIFLIFTSQAWNMTFGVYEALTTIPKDLVEVREAYELKGALAYRKLYLPACTNRLVYNSILSWAGGWYFLVATEIIAAGPINYRLPGLGSFLVVTSLRGELVRTFIGLAVLVSIIVLMDLLLWRPLTVWAEKFRYEFAAGATETHHSWLLGLFNRLRAAESVKLLLLALKELLAVPMRIIGRVVYRWQLFYRHRSQVRFLVHLLGRLIAYLLLLGVLYLTYLAVLALAKVIERPLPSEAWLIPLATLASMGRLAVAYLISLLWTIPIAVKISNSKRAARILTPLFEIIASVPATALFPLIVVFIVRYTGSVNLAAVLLVLTGMQWYLLFNLIAGASSIPRDLKEVTSIMGLRGWLYWRRLILPAIFPSLITGSITAWGGGWNALIIAEYFSYSGKTFTAFGVGSLLDKATYINTPESSQMILFSLVFMVSVIIVINRFFWRPLYNMATRRFKIEY